MAMRFEHSLDFQPQSNSCTLLMSYHGKHSSEFATHLVLDLLTNSNMFTVLVLMTSDYYFDHEFSCSNRFDKLMSLETASNFFCKDYKSF